MPSFTFEDAINSPQQAPAAMNTFTFEEVANKPTPSKRGFGREIGRQLGLTGRYVAEGLSGIADLPNFAINSIGAAAGHNPNLKYPSEILGSALTSIGVPEPQTPMERVVGDASRALAGAGGGIGSAKALSSYAPALTALANNAGLQAKAALGSSVAGGATREMGGGPLAQFAASLAGGGIAGKSSIPKRQAFTQDEIKAQAQAVYKKAAQVGGAIKPEYAEKIANELEKMFPQDRAAKLFQGNSPASQAIDKIKLLSKKPITLEEAQSIDESLGEAITDFILPTGKPNTNGMKLMKIRDSFRGSIENADENSLIGGKEGFQSWKEARALWSKSLKLGDVERILTKADGADHPATVIKNGFATIKNNPKRFAAYNAEEKKAIEKAAKTGVIGELLRIPGSRLVPIIGASTGSVLGAAGGAATGIAARSARGALQARRALNVAETIAGKKPRDLKSPLLAISAGTLQGINNNKQ